MPYKKKRTYRKKKRTFRRYIRKYKKKAGLKGQYGKLATVGMPHNMYTYMKLSTPMFTYTLGANYTDPAGFMGQLSHNFILCYNQQNPLNLTLTGTGTSPPLPDTDANFLGTLNGAASDSNPTTVIAGQYGYNQISWWANWYNAMRITNSWVKVTIRPVQGLLEGSFGTGLASSAEPMYVTMFNSKYVVGVNTPEQLASMDIDDIANTRGAKTYSISGIRYKALSIKKHVSVKKFLGVKDMKDTGYDTQCRILPNLALGSNNPTSRNKVFGMINVRRRGDDPTLTTALQRYTIQFEIVSKVHLSQLKRNNPTSIYYGPTSNAPENDDPVNLPPPPPV